MAFSKASLEINADREIARIANTLRGMLGQRLKRRGAVIGLSGGIDSSVVAALCVRALGQGPRARPAHARARVLGRDAASEQADRRHARDRDASTRTSRPMLDAAGCYRRRDEAIRTVIPDYGPGWKSKIVLPSVVDSDMFRIYSVVAQAPDGKRRHGAADAGGVPRDRRRDQLQAARPQDARVLPRRSPELRGRRHAEPAGVRPGVLRQERRRRGRRQADRPPVQDAGLSSWPQRSACPEEIRSRPPTTDTYSLQPVARRSSTSPCPTTRWTCACTPRTTASPPPRPATVLGLTAEQVERVYRDIDAKRAFARYLHMAPLLGAVSRTTDP